MVALSFIWFLILYGGTFYFARDKNIFSPLRFVSAKFALSNLIFILYTVLYPESFPSRILKVCGVTLNDAFYKYTIVQTVAFCSLIAPIIFMERRATAIDKLNRHLVSYKSSALRLVALALFMAGAAGYCLFLMRIGGLTYLINNLNNRVALQAGQYILGLLPLCLVSCLLHLINVRLYNKGYDKVLFVLSALLLALMYSSLGGRKDTVIMFIILVVGIHFIVKPLKFTKKSVAVFVGSLLLLCSYIVIMPILRNSQHPVRIKSVSAFTIKTIAYHTSYTFIDVFATNYFNKDNLWKLKGYFMPAEVLYTNKTRDSIPQVDQGVYFYSIVARGHNYAPPVERSKLEKASWPTENLGFAYSNFLLPGVIFFFFLQGFVFVYSYRMLRADVYNPALLIQYVMVILIFNFSSLRIAGFIKLLPLLYLCHVIYNYYICKYTFLESLKIKLKLNNT